MPSGLIGTVMLTLRGRGIGRSELIQRVLWLRDEIVDRGGNVADFPPEGTAIIVDRTLAVLSGLVGVHKDLLEPVYYVTKRFELSYYRNELIHLFLVDCTLFFLGEYFESLLESFPLLASVCLCYFALISLAHTFSQRPSAARSTRASR